MPSSFEAHNPRAEAQGLVGPNFEPVVLEPSPPAITDEFFADDPAATVGAHTVVAPDGRGDISWDEWLLSNPDHTDWVAERWLGGDRSLGSVPASLPATRTDLHRLAAYVIAPARHAATGKFGLRFTHGGFGTPFFGADRQIRVQGDQLIDQVGSEVRNTTIESLARAAAFLDTAIDPSTAAEHDSPALGDVDESLTVDSDACNFLGRWFGMAFAALEAVRADDASIDASRPQLWPGHFDPAIEVGDVDHRASYGASPGDHSIDEPYLYVSAWWPDRLNLDRSNPLWNATAFTGTMLKLSDFGDGDPVGTAADFYRTARNALGRA
ncbi:MAG: hypothetical protein HKN24_15035 [Acidimicrobiales bacterium]|nr:hypothetical protein [Acidimicrobiales bacterium]